MARSKPTTPAQYRAWSSYTESLIQQSIDILDGDVDLEEGWDLEPSLAFRVGGESQNI
jgi:hypothetical protein